MGRLVITMTDVVTGEIATKVVSLSPVLIGRDPDSVDIFIDRPSVSKLHGEFIFSDDGIFYRDLDSRNGSIINGQPVPTDAQVAFSEGAILLVGGRVKILLSGRVSDVQSARDRSLPKDPETDERARNVLPPTAAVSAVGSGMPPTSTLNTGASSHHRSSRDDSDRASDAKAIGASSPADAYLVGETKILPDSFKVTDPDSAVGVTKVLKASFRGTPNGPAPFDLQGDARSRDMTTAFVLGPPSRFRLLIIGSVLFLVVLAFGLWLF